MPMIEYRSMNLRRDTLDVIDKANEIIKEYTEQGFDLTVRQLYYQFVARDLLANTDKNYKRLCSIVNDGRLAGLIDWNVIADRTRYLRQLAHWSDPAHIIDACASQFRIDKWDRQPHVVEVWIEKDALIGVIEGVCQQLDVPYLACRGYASQSEVWRAGQRLSLAIDGGRSATVFYLGDHDPSGIDMTRDIESRLRMFTGLSESDETLTVNRLALNSDQVKQYKPPKNPTKLTDSRAKGYIEEHGRSCWELDALSPTVIAGLIRDSVELLMDMDAWDSACADEKAAKEELNLASQKWPSVARFVRKGK